MRIGTWNVEYAKPQRLDALRRVMSQNSADIWVLTETHDELVPQGCPSGLHCEARPRNSYRVRPGSRWVSIWTRYPIISQVTLPNADTERTVVALLSLGPSQIMLVYGTVLPWKGDRRFDWVEHHRVIPEQCSEWLELRKKYPEAALCIAGDYNTDMGTGSSYGTEIGIAALHAGLSDCELFCATEPSRFPPGLLTRSPIDHISLPIAWKDSTSVVAAWPVNKKALSDHSGVIVEVTGR